MRVIAGKFKGRNIETLKDHSPTLRPTTGVAREALFNILSHGQFAEDGTNILHGARVLDLYCGSGALAIEAMSRGAGYAVFIDMEKKHLDIARKNIEKLGESENAAFIRADSSNPPPAHVPCNLVFIDPPYNKGLAQITLENLMKGNWLTKDAILVIETAKREDVIVPEGFEELEDRTYGNSRMRIIRWNGQGQTK